MDIDKLTDAAKRIVEERGGTDALKEDLSELKDIASSEGSLTDKAKRAAEAIKDPGAPGEDEAEKKPEGQAPADETPPAGG